MVAKGIPLPNERLLVRNAFQGGAWDVTIDPVDGWTIEDQVPNTSGRYSCTVNLATMTFEYSEVKTSYAALYIDIATGATTPAATTPTVEETTATIPPPPEGPACKEAGAVLTGTTCLL